MILFENAPALLQWSHDTSIGTLFIEPGSPSENGYVESFNGRMRDELLVREIFYTVKEARRLIEVWRWEYNHVRPNRSLGYKPPAPSAWITITEPMEQVNLSKKVDQEVGTGHYANSFGG